MTYHFDAYALDTDRFELRRHGTPLAVEPQVLSLLAFLVANRERLVHKEELLEAVWGGRAVSDAAISSRIKSARQAIGDDGHLQRYIRTVHGQGFRFVGEVRAKSAEASSASAEAPQGREPVAGRSGPTKPTIAVLPFTNLSDEPGQEYFADAIAQDVLSALSKHRWLNVVARNTSFGYKGRSVDARTLAAEIGASYVVEGSVRRTGDRIRVAAQLVDTATGTQTWSERYDSVIEDVFAVQDDITDRIAARLEPEIGFAERQRVARRPHTDLQAWDCLHLGLAHLFKFTGPDNLEAQRLLHESRNLDPQCGEAHAWWAYAVVLGMIYWDTAPVPERLDEALRATTRALDLDERNGVFYALKARVQLARGDYASARSGNETAIRLNPTLAAAHCGLADTLVYEGRYDEALEWFNKAVDLSPNDPQRWAFLSYGALALLFKRDYDLALGWIERALEVPNCQYWTLAHKAVALAGLGRLEDAGQAVAELLGKKPGFSLAFAQEKLFYLKRPEQRRFYLDLLAKAGVA